jgi:hypothetical protein
MTNQAVQVLMLTPKSDKYLTDFASPGLPERS